MVEHPAARALTGYLLVRGGVHQVAYARALENLTGADLTKLFPSPRIPTETIPECQPHIERGEHLTLYRFSLEDFREVAAVFNGKHPETGEELVVAGAIARGRAGARPAGPAGRLRAGPGARGDRADRAEAEGEGRPPKKATGLVAAD
jgi:Mn-containing catalase